MRTNEETASTSLKVSAAARWVLLSVVAALLVVAVVQRSSVERGEGDSIWALLRLDGDEVEGYSSLRDMGRAADLVVRGHVANVGPTRQVQGDAPEDVVTYVTLEIAVDERVSGPKLAGLVPVEFLVNVPPPAVDAFVQDLETSRTDEELLIFLRSKGAAEQGRYRLVNSKGLWRSNGQGVDAPLAVWAEPELRPGTSGRATAPFAEEIAGVSQIGQLVEYLRGNGMSRSVGGPQSVPAIR